MNYILFEWNGWGYRCKQTSCEKMYLIGDLFRSEIRSPPPKFFIKWLDNSNNRGAGGNIMEIDLSKNREQIEIRNSLDEEDGPVFKISRNQYIKTFWLWYVQFKKQPKEIVIFWDGKEITVEGRD